MHGTMHDEEKAMPDNLVNSSFGEILRVYRERSIDKRMRKRLSQDKLALVLSEKTGLMFNRNNIGNWETGKSVIPADDRKTLLTIIKIFFEHEGIASQEDANRLLEAGNYRTLNNEEKAMINPEWKQTESKPVVENHNNESPNEELSNKTVGATELYPAECGNMPINLAQQRLLVSTSFGTYFTGLLEKNDIYLELESQINCPAPKQQEGLRPLQRIFWLLEHSKGPRTMIIAGEGGMGKSTLSARIIRCLYQEQAFDMILGDSAKSEHLDPITKSILKYQPGYYDPISFFDRMCQQLGLPSLPKHQAINAIRDRLIGRKAIIIVDNLETVEKTDEILDALKTITSRDVRAIVTARQVFKLKTLSNEFFIVQLHPLRDERIARQFLLWHIEQHQSQQPTLRELKTDIDQHIRWLIERTGGIPLLMQLVLSDVARYSWNYIQTLPSLFGEALLDYLYQTRWNDLGRHGNEGNAAKQILVWVAREQYRGKEITAKDITDWMDENGNVSYLSAALELLFERFLIINRDPRKGNFAVYPSLADFIGKQHHGFTL